MYHEILNYYEKIGHKYVQENLKDIDLIKLDNDPKYAIKQFFFNWGFERQGTPLGFRIAAIKAIETIDNGSYKDEFKKYYTARPNERNNPFFDEEIINLNIQSIIQKIKKREFGSAFKSLKLKGVGHKIRAFFLRDIVHLLELEKQSKLELADYMYMNPIDVWVRFTVKYLKINEPTEIKLKHSTYNLEKPDFITALKLSDTCIKLDISPLLTNMGIWYFASRYIADSGRLEKLLTSENPIDAMNNEISLLNGYR